MNDLIIDCFAGGGGASTGIELALNRPIDIAINHDPDAILMHKTNHPHTLHLTEDIFEVDLQKHVRGRRVSLMWALIVRATAKRREDSRENGGCASFHGPCINTQGRSGRKSSSWRTWRKYSSGVPWTTLATQ